MRRRKVKVKSYPPHHNDTQSRSVPINIHTPKKKIEIKQARKSRRRCGLDFESGLGSDLGLDLRSDLRSDLGMNLGLNLGSQNEPWMMWDRL